MQNIRVIDYPSFWAEKTISEDMEKGVVFMGTYDEDFNDNALYAITSDGRVYSYQKRQFFAPYESSNHRRHDTITMVFDKQRYTVCLPRLIATCFKIDGYENLTSSDYHIHHKDKNHQNNRISNLQVLSKDEHNKLHAEQRKKH